MAYEEELEHDHDDVVSDEEQEITEMGPIEGLPGDVGVDMEIVGMDVERDDDDELDDSEVDDSDEMDEDEEDEDEMDEDVEDMEEVHAIEDGEEGSIGADDEDWGTDEEDGEEYSGQNEIEDDQGPIQPLDDIVRVLGGNDSAGLLQRLEDGVFDNELNIPHEPFLEGEMGEEGNIAGTQIPLVYTR